MGNLVLALTEADLVELQGIVIDQDKEAALQFLQAKIAPKLSCDSGDCNCQCRNA